VCNGLSRFKLNELFTLDDNNRGTRKHSWKLWAGNLPFWGTLIPKSPKADESASHREVEFPKERRTTNVTLEMRRS